VPLELSAAISAFSLFNNVNIITHRSQASYSAIKNALQTARVQRRDVIVLDAKSDPERRGSRLDLQTFDVKSISDTLSRQKGVLAGPIGQRYFLPHPSDLIEKTR
jgi:hypothetical protein